MTKAKRYALARLSEVSTIRGVVLLAYLILGAEYSPSDLANWTVGLFSLYALLAIVLPDKLKAIHEDH